MKKLVLKSLAKINLSLDVLGRRKDGYHDVEMVMQTVYLSDTVELRLRSDERITLESNLPYLPCDSRNIAVKAARALFDYVHTSSGVHIRLNKQIPVAAGLAGGSSNAAAVLFGLNRLLDLGLSTKELADIGVKIGADVPYCLWRGTALAQGIGEKITLLPPMPPCTVLLAKPPVSVSTRDVYEALAHSGACRHPQTEKVIESIRRRDISMFAEAMGNVLEPVTEQMHPVVGDLRRCMLENGAYAAMMSGSGPTVFGLFTDRERAKYVRRKIIASGMAKQVYVTKIHNRRETNGSVI